MFANGLGFSSTTDPRKGRSSCALVWSEVVLAIAELCAGEGGQGGGVPLELGAGALSVDEHAPVVDALVVDR